VELLPADPEPLCALCYVSDSSITAPSLLLVTNASWNGTTPSRTPSSSADRFRYWQPDPDGSIAAHRRARSRRLTLVAAVLALVGILFAAVPMGISATKPGPVHIGVQQVDAGTNACLANLYVLIVDKNANRSSPPDMVCPVCGKPYVYSQYEGLTTISCPNPVAHNQTRIYVRSDVGIPVVN
jgi:hypothetical protein